MTSHSDDECPVCGAGGYNEGYCWDCGYDKEHDEAMANARDITLIDQPEPDVEDDDGQSFFNEFAR